MLAKLADPKYALKWVMFLVVGAVVCGALNKYVFKT